MKIPVNKTGYLKGAKTAKNPVNIIPSSLITTQGMAFPIKANGKTLYPNTGQYKFPTPNVVETPLKKKGTDELVPNKMSKTSLSKAQEIAYQRWMKFKGYNESDDYDMRDYWKNEGFKNLGSPKGGDHFPDTYKRLAPFSEGDNYPTLSDESNRASKFDKRGQGTWTKEGKYVNYQEGTEGLNAMSYAKFPNRIKDKKRRDTQIADIYNATLDDHKGDTTNAKRAFKSFFTHYGSERFDNIKPLEGYYGFDKKDYEDSTLDSLGKNWHKQIRAPKKQQGTKNAKVEPKREPEFGAGLFGNLFGKAGNPVADKKENVKRRQEFETATKRGLSSEGLGDLAMGLSGEAIAGAATKVGGKLYKAASPYIKKAGKYLTTKTPLKDVYKLNPWAYKGKEGMMYRGLGKEGMEDAVESGLFRAKQDVIPEYYPGSKLRMNKSFSNPYFTPKFKTAATYGDNYLAEVPRNVANWRQRYKRTNWSQVADKPIPIKEGKILEKHWLKGYKPLQFKNGSKGVSLAFSRGEKDPKGGLTQKGVDKYNRATGGNLKMAVTTPPSKLKADSKAANRRKSFCSRMKGMKSKLTSAKTANDPNSRINKSLRKWNCN
jgi:hypothetical protein